MIRTALLSDKSRVIQLLRDSREGAGFDGLDGFHFTYDPAYAEKFFLQHLNSPSATCIVLDIDGTAQGMLCAVAYEHSYGPVRVAKETMWWIDPAHRGPSARRMIAAFEAWAKEQRCTYTGLAGMGEEPAVQKFYERCGYRAAELHFLKAI
jgi:GNAT superfamily N-acetyltransferase